MIKESILVIDDEASIRSSLQGILEDEGYRVGTAETGEDGLQMVQDRSYDLVLLDVWLPKMGGMEVLERLRPADDAPPVVMISGHGTIETAVRATKLGAFDFLEKPLSLEKVVLTVQNALKQKRLEDENIQLRQKVLVNFPLIGVSPAIQRLSRDIERASPSNGRVFICGENGTGMEQIAAFIHRRSHRANHKFVVLNCAALPDPLIESELFGYRHGAAPGAVKDKKGKLLLADRGTLFLAEIGEMNLQTQSALVRVIENGAFEPSGSADSVPVDVRITAGSTFNPKDLIARGKLREDLFFKLNVIPLAVPPLRERTEDIPLLIAHFLGYFSSEYGRKPKTMSVEAQAAFLNYPWPGNIFELMNVIERFVIMVPDEEITAAHLNLLVETRETDRLSMEDLALAAARERFERHFIQKALVRNGWDVPRAAQDLKVSEPEIRRKIRDYNITFID